MDFKGYLFLGTLVLALVSLSFWGGRCSAPSSFSTGKPDTVMVVVPDTVWRTVVRVKTLTQTRHDTIWATIPAKPTADTLLYIIAADTVSERFRAHLEYAQLAPLHPEGFFQNVRVDIRDSVKTIHTIERVPQYVETVSLPWMIGALSVGAALGIWIGSR